MADDTEAKLERYRGENHAAFVMGYSGETGRAIVRELSSLKVFKKVLLMGRRHINLGPDVGPEFVSLFQRLEKICDAMYIMYL